MRNYSNDLCLTCLSRGRRLVALHKITFLIKEISFLQFKESSGGVCWECWSIMLKYQQFKAKASLAQETLKQTKEQLNIQSLSTLSSKTNLQNDQYTYNNDPLINSDINPKEEIDFIKVENDDSDDTSAVDTEEITYTDVTKTDIENVYVEVLEAKNEEKIKTKKLNKVKFKKRNSEKINKIDENEIKEKFVEVILSEDDLFKIRDEKRNHPNFKKLPFKCDSCVLGFMRKDTYNTHMEKKHDENVGDHSCHICSVRFSSKLSLNNHRLKHYVCYKCKFCKHEAHEFWSALNHCKTKHVADKQDSIHCGQCDAVVKTPEDLEIHVQNKHTLYCNECGVRFKGMSTLRRHKTRIHAVKREFICDICKKTFKTKTRLESHMVNHNSTIAKNLAYCQLCKIQYKSIYVYRDHLKYSANHSERSYSCPECNKKFASKVYWTKHYNFYHLQKSQFNCEICNKLFISDWRLKNHRQKHHGLSRPRDHACNTCGKKFFTKATLRSHELTHSEQRTYMCEDCGDTFKQSAALYTHSRLVHKGGGRRK